MTDAQWWLRSEQAIWHMWDVVSTVTMRRRKKDGRDAVPYGHLLERAARVADHDRRAVDTLRELVNLQWEHARALASARVSIHTGEHTKADGNVEDLEQRLIELERTLEERPWTEV